MVHYEHETPPPMTSCTKGVELRSSAHQAFFPSEILHSRTLPSTSVASTKEDKGHRVILICHKDRTSFYKSTRKACRTANRIWSAYSDDADGGTQSVSVTCGYFIGEKQPLTSPPSLIGSKSDDLENSAIHKRLSSEFGPRSAKALGLPNANIIVHEYNSNCQSDQSPQCPQERLNVIFFDLDTIDSDSATAQSSSGSDKYAQDHYDMMQTVLSSTFQEKSNEEMNSIVHVRSETIHRIVTSLRSSISLNNDSNQKQHCVSDAEIEKYLISHQKNERGATDNASSNSSNVIRRLRERKGAANCPLTIYPSRFIEIACSSSVDDCRKRVVRTVEICRFHNYDSERGCLRSKKALQNLAVKGCDLDHDHCHRCGGRHRAFECPHVSNSQTDNDHLSSVVFRENDDGSISCIPLNEHTPHTPKDIKSLLPALLVLGGRMRGRTLATCEMLPLSSSSASSNEKVQKWMPLPNLCEHRGSHAACSPTGSGLVFVLGGGTVDGNSDTVEILDFGFARQSPPTVKNHGDKNENEIGDELRWHKMAGKLSSPRHAFGAVTCMTKKDLYAVGGWQYGSISCESMERLHFERPDNKEGSTHHFDLQWLHNHAQWEECAPLILPRRLHSVAASSCGSSIYVFGGYIDERRTTHSIEKYDIDTDRWSAPDELPYGATNCPLVQAVAYQNGFLIFPYSTEHSKGGEAPVVLRYIPGSDTPFSPMKLPKNDKQNHLHLPISNWHSFSATSSLSLNRAFLVGGTINGKWTDRSFELDFDTMEWKELPAMTFPCRRLATLVLE